MKDFISQQVYCVSLTPEQLWDFGFYCMAMVAAGFEDGFRTNEEGQVVRTFEKDDWVFIFNKDGHISRMKKTN